MPSWVSFDPSLKVSLKDLVEKSDKDLICFFTCIYHQDFFKQTLNRVFVINNA